MICVLLKNSYAVGAELGCNDDSCSEIFEVFDKMEVLMLFVQNNHLVLYARQETLHVTPRRYFVKKWCGI